MEYLFIGTQGSIFWSNRTVQSFSKVFISYLKSDSYMEIIYITIGIHGGACGVVVIAVGNEHGDTSSNPGRD